MEFESKKLKCPLCQKNIKLSEQLFCKCQCGITFCPAHRLPSTFNTDNTHQCSFDHKLTEIKNLQTANPKLIVDKIPGRI